MRKKKDQPDNMQLLLLIIGIIIFAIVSLVGWTTMTNQAPATTPIPGFNQTATAYVEQDAVQQSQNSDAFNATATALIEQSLVTEEPDDE